MVSDSYAWRQPQRVVDLKLFDFPQLHERSDFHSDKIAAMAAPRMAGCSIRRSPEEIHEAVCSGEFDGDTRSYLSELMMQFDCYDIRRFAMYCGASSYELARAMIECEIDLRLLTEWMNCQSPLYQSKDTHHRTWDLGARL